jgi:two-component system NtrC family sensor kinase
MEDTPKNLVPSAESPAKVLAVDDIRTNLKLLDVILGTLDCQVVLARSGDEALALLERDEFAVVVLDVKMPGMDGYEVANRARGNVRTRDVPIIFLTAGERDPRDVLRGYDSGAVDFLFKPVDATILRSKVKVFLDLYESRRRIARAKRELDKAYQDLTRTQTQLIHSAKMASLGELVAGIAHEINNPLAFVLAHIGTTRRSFARVEELVGAPLQGEASEDWTRGMNRLSECVVGLERIRALVSKLRVFSRMDEGERKLANVPQCLDAVLMILSHRISDRVAVETELEAPPLLDCYPGLLNQALLNLVANALDVTPEGGRITVQTTVFEGEYRLSVTDHGPGIPTELRDRVFEPFFTTKQAEQGTGLGLSITDSIARQHGGSIEFECPESGGTVFTLRLPLQPPPPSPPPSGASQ